MPTGSKASGTRPETKASRLPPWWIRLASDGASRWLGTGKIRRARQSARGRVQRAGGRRPSRRRSLRSRFFPTPRRPSSEPARARACLASDVGGRIPRSGSDGRARSLVSLLRDDAKECNKSALVVFARSPGVLRRRSGRPRTAYCTCPGGVRGTSLPTFAPWLSRTIRRRRGRTGQSADGRPPAGDKRHTTVPVQSLTGNPTRPRPDGAVIHRPKCQQRGRSKLVLAPSSSLDRSTWRLTCSTVCSTCFDELRVVGGVFLLLG